MSHLIRDPSVYGPFFCSFVWGLWSVWLKDVTNPVLWWGFGVLSLAAFATNPILAGWGRYRDSEKINALEEVLVDTNSTADAWMQKTTYFITLLETLKTLLYDKCSRYLRAVENGGGEPTKTSKYLHDNDSLQAALTGGIDCFFEFLKSKWRDGNEDVTLAFFAPDDTNSQLLPKAVADLAGSKPELWIKPWDLHHFQSNGGSFASFLWREADHGRYSPVILQNVDDAMELKQWEPLSSKRSGSAAGCAVVDRGNSGREFLGVLVVTISRVNAFESREEEMRRFLDVVSTDILFETRKQQYRVTAWV